MKFVDTKKKRHIVDGKTSWGAISTECGLWINDGFDYAHGSLTFKYKKSIPLCGNCKRLALARLKSGELSQ